MAEYIDSYNLEIVLDVNGKKVEEVKKMLDGTHTLDLKLGEEYRGFINQLERGFTTNIKLNFDQSALDRLSSMTFGSDNMKVTFANDELYLDRLVNKAELLKQTINSVENAKAKKIFTFNDEQLSKPRDERTSAPKAYKDYIKGNQSLIKGYVKSLTDLEAVEKEILKIDSEYQRETYQGQSQRARKLFQAQVDPDWTYVPKIPARNEIATTVKETQKVVQEEMGDAIKPSINEFIVTDQAIASIESQISEKLKINLNSIIGGDVTENSGLPNVQLSLDGIGDSIVNAIQTALSNANLTIDKASINVQSAESAKIVSSGEVKTETATTESSDKKKVSSATAERELIKALRLINQANSRAMKSEFNRNTELAGKYQTTVNNLSTASEAVEKNATPENVKALAEAVSKARKELIKFDGEYDIFQNKLKTDTATQQAATSAQNLSIRLTNLRKNMEKYGQVNTAFKKDSMLSSQYDSLMKRAGDMDISNPDAIKVLSKDFTNFQRKVAELGKTGMSTGDRIKAMYEKFGGWSLVTRSLTRVYSLIRKIGTAVKELDTSMVNLKKVSDGTAKDYENFLSRAAVSAQKLGTSITDLVDATAEFSRLGYNLEDSATLGEYATLYSRVAEDLSASDAAQSLVSIMKAFKYNAQDAVQIVDLLNYVGRIIAQARRNARKQIAISVKSQRWSRPRKDL